jgi:adenosylcobinamide-GDP ribazoletransferase
MPMRIRLGWRLWGRKIKLSFSLTKQIRLFLAAVQFFTRIPVPAWVGHSAQQLDESARYFPLVGMGVGGVAAVVLWSSALVLPLALAIVLSMLASVFITGAFHEDGLSDFVDGMGGGYTREKTLAIMKDSRVGAYGVIALVLAAIMKFEVLLALADKYSLFVLGAILVVAHGISRMLAVSVMLTQRYVRDDDSARAKPVAQSLSQASFTIAALTGLVAIALLLASGVGLFSVLGALACALLLRVYLGRKMQKHLGGYTGDCLGAVQQITELGFYLGLLMRS